MTLKFFSFLLTTRLSLIYSHFISYQSNKLWHYSLICPLSSACPTICQFVLRNPADIETEPEIESDVGKHLLGGFWLPDWLQLKNRTHSQVHSNWSHGEAACWQCAASLLWRFIFLQDVKKKDKNNKHKTVEHQVKGRWFPGGNIFLYTNKIKVWLIIYCSNNMEGKKSDK